MENYFDVSVILPIKSSLTRGFNEYFEKCIESLKTQKLKIFENIVNFSERNLELVIKTRIYTIYNTR